MAELGNGLSDFGLTSPNDATSVDSGPSLADMLSDAVLDETATAKQLSAKIDEAGAAEAPTLIDKLLGPRGLALLAGSIGVGLGGGGLGGAAAFAAGGAKGTQGVVAAERSAQNAAIEKLEGDLEKSQARLDKTRNRIANVYNTNPDSFLNPDGTPAVDARVLGWYVTGTDIPLFPQTRRLLNQRDERWSKRMDVLSEALENTDNAEDATNITRAMMRQLQWFDADDATVQSIVNSIGTEDFDATFAGILFKHGGASALDAMIFAGEEGLPLNHPEVLRRIDFRTQDEDGGQPPSQVLNQRFIDAMDAVNTFEQNPINAKFVQETKQGNTPEEARKLIATQALADTGSAEVDFYLDRVNAFAPQDFQRFQSAYSQISSKSSLVDSVRGGTSLKEKLGLTDQEWANLKAEQAQEVVAQGEKAARLSAANQNAVLNNQAAGKINGALPNLGVQAVYGLVDKIAEAAAAQAKKNPDGTIDRADYERLFNAFTASAIQQNKE